MVAFQQTHAKSTHIALSSKGRTQDFESCYGGSNPSRATYYMNFDIDEQDIVVGRVLYFIKDGNNSKDFVGKISEILPEWQSVDGCKVVILFPMNPGKERVFARGDLKQQIEDGHIVIK